MRMNGESNGKVFSFNGKIDKNCGLCKLFRKLHVYGNLAPQKVIISKVSFSVGSEFIGFICKLVRFELKEKGLSWCDWNRLGKLPLVSVTNSNLFKSKNDFPIQFFCFAFSTCHENWMSKKDWWLIYRNK